MPQNLMTICVDVMGGDEKPEVILEGMSQALAECDDIKLVAVGPQEIVDSFVACHGDRAEALYSQSVIEMDEHPAEAVRKKRDSSIVLACKALKEGKADAFFSAGSTGAVLAAATLYTGRSRGVIRPAIGYMLPTTPPLLGLDLGANADVRPDMLVQFGQMGAAYMRTVCGVEQPRVGLLNIGAEKTKGSEFAQEVHELMEQKLPEFTGNCEGTDLFGGKFDVVVCDGFTGNIMLKTIEGTAKFLLTTMKQSFLSSLRSKIGALLLKPALSEIKDLLNADAAGGAPLLGIRSVVVIGHGKTSSRAVLNGIKACRRAVEQDLVGQIAQSVAQYD